MIIALCLALFVGCVASSVSYYELLQVDAKVTAKELKKRYRALALTYHPDRHLTPEAKQLAEETFGNHLIVTPYPQLCSLRMLTKHPAS
jgi:preprotein translocase subunit Sec63